MWGQPESASLSGASKKAISRCGGGVPLCAAYTFLAPHTLAKQTQCAVLNAASRWNGAQATRQQTLLWEGFRVFLNARAREASTSLWREPRTHTHTSCSTELAIRKYIHLLVLSLYARKHTETPTARSRDRARFLVGGLKALGEASETRAGARNGACDDEKLIGARALAIARSQCGAHDDAIG
jgi:hypothetical protein